MKRTSIWLKAAQIKKLKSIENETGARMSAIIRKAIDEYVERRAPAEGQK